MPVDMSLYRHLYKGEQVKNTDLVYWGREPSDDVNEWKLWGGSENQQTWWRPQLIPFIRKIETTPKGNRIICKSI
jgi:hypothetical protein